MQAWRSGHGEENIVDGSRRLERDAAAVVQAVRRLNLEMHEREVTALAIAQQVAGELGLQLLHEGGQSGGESEKHQSRAKGVQKRRGKANSWLKLEHNTTHGMHLRLPGKDQKLLSRKGKQGLSPAASGSAVKPAF